MKLVRLEPLAWYVRGTLLLGCALLGLLVWRGTGSLGHVTGLEILLAVALVPAEMLPIVLNRRGKDTDSITMSTTYAFALLLCAPLLFAVLAQCVAVAVDDLRRGGSPRKLLWNCSQYVITLTASRAVFGFVDGRGLLEDNRPLSPRTLLAVLAAAVVYFVLNNGMTTVVVALAERQSVRPTLIEDARFRLSIFAVLLGLAPVAVVTVELSPWLLPVLFFAIAAVQRSAALALERERQSLHDALTGLPNRVMLVDECERAIDRQIASGGVGLLIVDLDHFKEVNDTLGHQVGDALICEVGRRLQALVAGGDLVARLGGDEFAVLRRSIGDPDLLIEQAGNWLAVLEQPYSLDGVRLSVGASIGVALAPRDAVDAGQLIQRADVALYAAKEQRGTVVAYDADRDRHSIDRLNLVAELRVGIARGELEVHYQPQCDCDTGVLVGLEALVRWRHPERGLLYPDAFIPAAETTTVINALTAAVLDDALGQLAGWRAVGIDVTVAVNVSARQMTDLDLPATVAASLARHAIPPSRLTLEVTESSMMADPGRTAAVLGALANVGVGLSIDDFGTGYSSMRYLTRLGAHELKIDRSFVMGMSANPDDAVIVRSIIELGHSLGMRVVAEGVETAAVWSALTDLDCDLGQGYLLSRPMPAAEVRLWSDDIAASAVGRILAHA